MEEYLETLEEDMAGALTALSHELGKIRTGRASPKLIDSIDVEVASYGARMPLNQLATVQAADARLLVVTPWDKSTLTDIEKGIVAAGLGLNPMSDGKILRVPVPPLTAQRRQELVRSVGAAAENAKVAARGTRRSYNDLLRQAEKDGEISEDDLRKALDRIQKATDAIVAKIDEVAAAKESEVREV